MQKPVENSTDACDNACDGPCISAAELIEIYYDEPSLLGSFERVESGTVPEVYRDLLDHSKHMTVTVESHHADRVDVDVLRSDIVQQIYRREILLKTHRSGCVVQYGIVRLNTKYLADSPRNEILAQEKPLGRVLIEHNVLREIELFDLLRVECGPVLADFFDVEPGTVTYGRTAIIHCDHEPAIELLEVVRPESESSMSRAD
jgi:chorismate-pyruvate lyase